MISIHKIWSWVIKPPLKTLENIPIFLHTFLCFMYITFWGKPSRKKESQMADKPGSVERAIIRLAMLLLARSSNLPSDDGPETVLLRCEHRPSNLVLLPIGFVLPQGLSACAVSSYLAVSPLPSELGGLFSATLSIGSPRPDVIRYCVSYEARTFLHELLHGDCLTI